MQVLEDARKVLAHNLKELRGNERQVDFATRAGIAYRTYQDMESGGSLAEYENIFAAAEAHHVGTARLFQDPDQQGSEWRDLIRALSTLDDTQIEGVLAAVRAAQGAPTPRAKKARAASGES